MCFPLGFLGFWGLEASLGAPKWHLGAHGGHLWALVGAIVTPSAALERHWVAQGAPKGRLSAVDVGKCW